MRQTIWVLLAAFATAMGAAGADDFYLKNGDRVVFYGDSITDQRLVHHLRRNLCGHAIPQAGRNFRPLRLGRRPRDRRRRRARRRPPAARCACLQTHRHDHHAGHERRRLLALHEATDKQFFDGYRHIVDDGAALPGIRITAIQPSPYDDVTRQPNFPGGYNEVMLSFGNCITNYAAEAGLSVADLNTGAVQMLTKANLDNAEDAARFSPTACIPRSPAT